MEDCDLSLFKNIYDDDGNQIPNPDYKPPNDTRHEAFKNTFSAALFRGLPFLIATSSMPYMMQSTKMLERSRNIKSSSLNE